MMPLIIKIEQSVLEDITSRVRARMDEVKRLIVSGGGTDEIARIIRAEIADRLITHEIFSDGQTAGIAFSLAGQVLMEMRVD